MHRNALIFPDPATFQPSRWEGEKGRELERNYLVPFSRGARMCLGFNLGWAELRLLFAHVFRKFDMEMADESPNVDHLPWRDTFGAWYREPHLTVWMKPARN